MKNAIGTRIRQAREAKGLTRPDLCEITNISRTSIQSYEGGATSPTATAMLTIAQALEVPLLWLYGLDDAEKQANKNPKSVYLPLYEIRATSGYGELIQTDKPATIPFCKEWLNQLTTTDPAQLLLVRMPGDSMHPKLYDQDIILLDKGQTTPKTWTATIGNYGNIYCVRINDGLYIKEVDLLENNQYRIASVNKTMYPEITTNIDNAQIIGRTIWHGHTHT